MLLVLLATAWAAPPPICVGLPYAAPPVCGATCPVTALTEECLELSAPLDAPLEVSGSGTLHVFAAGDLTDSEHLIPGLDVLGPGTVFVYGEVDPANDLPHGITIRGPGTDHPSVLVSPAATLNLVDVRVEGADGEPFGPTRNGNGIRVEADGKFTMTGGFLQDASGQLGAGAWISEGGQAVFTDVIFRRNVFDDHDVGPYAGRDVHSDGVLTLLGTTHEADSDSVSESSGGAVSATGTLVVQPSLLKPATFDGYEVTQDGGAILLYNDLGLGCTGIIDADVTTGSADGYGGAVAIRDCDSVVVQGRFVDTMAARGGGVSVERSTAVRVFQASFIDTSAEGDGGAIYADIPDLYSYYYYELHLEVNRSRFVRTTAEDRGGAIFGENGSFAVVNSYFEDADASEGTAASLQGSDPYSVDFLWTWGNVLCGDGSEGASSLHETDGYIEVYHSWFEGMGPVFSDFGYAAHLTIVDPVGEPFDMPGFGFPWLVQGTLADVPGAGSLGDIELPASSYTSLLYNHDDAIDGSDPNVAFQVNQDVQLLAMCPGSEAFRLHPAGQPASSGTDPYAIGDDLGALGGLIYGDAPPLQELALGPATPWTIDEDGDGFPTAIDCAPTNPYIHPLAAEVCDDAGPDWDCDGLIGSDDPDNDFAGGIWYPDIDEDGYGDPDPLGVVVGCRPPGSWSDNPEDCDDADETRAPNRPELCDDIDHDCDGLNTANAIDRVDVWVDQDSDGYVDTDLPPSGLECPNDVPPNVYAYGAWLGHDCDDAVDTVFTGAPELCNGYDDDCDDLVDGFDPDMLPGAFPTYYVDGDLDGVAGPDPIAYCGSPAQASSIGLRSVLPVDPDCDDEDPLRSPAFEEECGDGIDNDCDELIDSADQDSDVGEPFVIDRDADGYGDLGTEVMWCPDEPFDPYLVGEPAGAVLLPVGGLHDCDDNDDAIHPGAAEICGNGIDDDCLGGDGTLVDSYVDADGDGVGAGEVQQDCDAPKKGRVETAGDCDDGDPYNYPTNAEVCDGRDNDCDMEADNGLTFVDYFADLDADGYGAGSPLRTCDGPPTGTVTEGTDCDDTDPSIHPGARERCDGIDNDCDPDTDDLADAIRVFPDGDSDGFGAEGSTGELMCLEMLTDKVSVTRDDCDDGNVLVNPDMLEIPDNGIDDDCRDGDGRQYVAGGCAVAPTSSQPWSLLRRRR